MNADRAIAFGLALLAVAIFARGDAFLSCVLVAFIAMALWLLADAALAGSSANAIRGVTLALVVVICTEQAIAISARDHAAEYVSRTTVRMMNDFKAGDAVDVRELADPTPFSPPGSYAVQSSPDNRAFSMRMEPIVKATVDEQTGRLSIGLVVSGILYLVLLFMLKIIASLRAVQARSQTT